MECFGLRFVVLNEKENEKKEGKVSRGVPFYAITPILSLVCFFFFYSFLLSSSFSFSFFLFPSMPRRNDARITLVKRLLARSTETIR